MIVSGLVIGYWFISVFVPNAKRERTDADRHAAQQRDSAPPVLAPPAEPPPVPAPIDPPPLPTRAWHEVLGVAPDAGRTDIREAYEAALLRHSPEDVASLTAEKRALARFRTRELHEAYEVALRARG
ncbi:J domain-containing protein [Cognatilysobacter bugurensis]|uniref:J domain-containing protein n=1 Tax=Cognatilysobacter bugurensis TaxID=543356 RepID=UPI00167BC884|nr:J domain-containing protein [Lysobacter bugurensis]